MVVSCEDKDVASLVRAAGPYPCIYSTITTRSVPKGRSTRGPLRSAVTLDSSCIIPISSVPVACTFFSQFKIGTPTFLQILNMIQWNRQVVIVLTTLYVCQQVTRGGNLSQSVRTMWFLSQVTRLSARDIDILFCTMSQKNMATNVRVTFEVPT